MDSSFRRSSLLQASRELTLIDTADLPLVLLEPQSEAALLVTRDDRNRYLVEPADRFSYVSRRRLRGNDVLCFTWSHVLGQSCLSVGASRSSDVILSNKAHLAEQQFSIKVDVESEVLVFCDSSGTTQLMNEPSTLSDLQQFPLLTPQVVQFGPEEAIIQFRVTPVYNSTTEQTHLLAYYSGLQSPNTFLKVFDRVERISTTTNILHLWRRHNQKQTMLAVNSHTRQLLAVKIVQGNSNDDELKALRREATFLRRTNCDYIVSCETLVECENYGLLLTELPSGGSLCDLVASHQTIRPEIAHVLAFSILKALHVIHAQMYSHNQIHPTNILFLHAEGRAPLFKLSGFEQLGRLDSTSMVNKDIDHLRGCIWYALGLDCHDKAEDATEAAIKGSFSNLLVLMSQRVRPITAEQCLGHAIFSAMRSKRVFLDELYTLKEYKAHKRRRLPVTEMEDWEMESI